MKLFPFLTIFIACIVMAEGHATETCSRTAIINNQEVLIDNSSNQKGEGLRFHLEKDSVAKSYLDEYQSGTGVNWVNAAIGTSGTLLILSELFSNSSVQSSKKLVVAGASLLVINFLVARTLQAANENNLIKAIDEYNQRNAPRIIYPVDQTDGERNPSSDVKGVYFEKRWRF